MMLEIGTGNKLRADHIKNEKFRTLKIRTITFGQKNFGLDFDIFRTNKENFGQNKNEKKLTILHLSYLYFEWTNHSS